MDNWNALQTCYEDWTEDEKQAIQDHMAKFGIHTIMLSQKLVSKCDPTVLLWWKYGAAQVVKTWVINRKWYISYFKETGASSIWIHGVILISHAVCGQTILILTLEMFVMHKFEKLWDGQRWKDWKIGQNSDWSTSWLYGSLPWPQIFNFMWQYSSSVVKTRKKWFIRLYKAVDATIPTAAVWWLDL